MSTADLLARRSRSHEFRRRVPPYLTGAQLAWADHAEAMTQHLIRHPPTVSAAGPGPRDGSGSAVGMDWPSLAGAGVQQCLQRLIVRGWRVVAFGSVSRLGWRGGSTAGAVCRWSAEFADVLLLGPGGAGVAYRAYLPAADADPLRPQRVVWHFVGTAAGAVEAVSLIPCAVLDAVPYAIPTECVPPDGPSTVVPTARGVPPWRGGSL